MTFDEAFEAEALDLFDRRADLEISEGRIWVHLFNEPLRSLIFSDRSRACEIASPSGIRLMDGRGVRFYIPTGARCG